MALIWPPLSSLTEPRSFCVIPHRRGSLDMRRHGILSRGCRQVSPGDPCDVALMLSPGAVPRAARFAATLYRGAALWTPTLQAGIAGFAPPRRRGRQCLVLSQGPAVAESLLAAAATLDFPFQAAICTAGPWLPLARLALHQDHPPRLLVALHRPSTAEELLQLTRIAGADGLLLLLSGAARQPLDLPPVAGCLPPAELGRGLGVPVATTPLELIELARLVERRAVRGNLRVRAVGATDDETALVQDALRGAGLRPVTVARGTAGTLAGPRAWKATDRRAWRLAPGPSFSAPADAGHATLTALATLARLPPPSPPGKRPRARVARARQLLDRWYRKLSEVQVLQLLECYGLRGAPGELVTSASMAGEVARRLGLPLTVKAVGPQLGENAPVGAVRRGIDSYAAARQAFRDVLQACARARPAADLDGVLVQATPRTCTDHLSALVSWSGQRPPLLVLANHVNEAPTVVFCPASREQTAHAATRVLGHVHGARRAGLSRFVHRLSWLAADLADRMRWLWLARICVPAGRTPPLVLDAQGEQSESLRNPLA